MELLDVLQSQKLILEVEIKAIRNFAKMHIGNNELGIQAAIKDIVLSEVNSQIRFLEEKNKTKK